MPCNREPGLFGASGALPHPLVFSDDSLSGYVLDIWAEETLPLAGGGAWVSVSLVLGGERS